MGNHSGGEVVTCANIESHFTHWARQVNVETGEPTTARHENTSPARVAEANEAIAKLGGVYRWEIIREYKGEAKCPCCPDYRACPLR